MVSVPSSTPEGGDLIWINFSPQVGHEQAGRRPALVVSNYFFNLKAPFIFVCPVTSHCKGYAFAVPLPAGCSINGVILANQLKSFDQKARQIEFSCKVPDDILVTVLKKILSICSHKSVDVVVARPEDILTSIVFHDIRTKLVEHGMVRKAQDHICSLMVFRFGIIMPGVENKIKLINNLAFLEHIFAKLLSSASQEEITDSVLGYTV